MTIVFSGDVGKAVVLAAIARLLTALAWRSIAALLAVLGMAAAAGLPALAPRQAPVMASRAGAKTGRSGFVMLMGIGAFDTATRMGYLLFLPFLIHAGGGSTATGGFALALLFAGAPSARRPAAGWASGSA